jgi:MFS superfamily sulfate permease-like transporter
MANRFAFHDTIAGIAVAGLMVPEAIAYAGLAGLTPARALVAAVVGGLCYAFVGRSRFAIIAPTSSSAAILAAGLGSLSSDGAIRSAEATAMIGIVGLLFAAFAILRLGALSGFVSRPVLRGFAIGLAVTIILKQLPKLLAIPVDHHDIGTIVVDLFANAGSWHPTSAAIGGMALVCLLAMRRVPQLPGALVILLAGIGASAFFHLGSSGVALAGPADLNIPTPSLPPLSLALWGRMTQLAAPIALILFAESWGTMRALALKHGDGLDANRELGALGAANILSALVNGMPVGAGFSAGSASEAAGAQSRVTAATASLAVLCFALFANGWIALIPEPVLAAIVIAALTHALSPAPILKLFRINRDGWIAVAAMVGVLAFGVLNGMLMAVALSIADLLHEFSSPTVSELGRLGSSHDFVDRRRHPEAATLPGISIFRPNAPLIFANAESVLNLIAARVRASDVRVVILSLEESYDLDSTAIEALGEFALGLKQMGTQVIFARAHDPVRDVLRVAGMDDLAQTSTFSVADAAEIALSGGDARWR